MTTIPAMTTAEIRAMDIEEGKGVIRNEILEDKQIVRRDTQARQTIRNLIQRRPWKWWLIACTTIKVHPDPTLQQSFF